MCCSMPVRTCVCLTVTALWTAVVTLDCRAENWPQFRGASFDAVANSTVPLTWDTHTNVKWKAPLEGEGWSCPVVWGDRVFLTCAVPEKNAAFQPPRERARERGNNGPDPGELTYSRQVLCFSAKTGELLWKQVAAVGKPPIGRHADNSFATETPVADDKHVYAYFGMVGLFCYDHSGQPVWSRNLGQYEMRNDWGTASSPVLYNGKIFQQVDCDDQSFVVALDARTGNEIWRQDRPEPSQYSTPVIWQNSQRTELVTAGLKARSYDPETGKLWWECSLSNGRSSAAPLVSGDLVILGNEKRSNGDEYDGGGVLYAIRPGASGDVSLAEGESSSLYVAWALPESGIAMSSPVACEGRVYVLDRRGGVIHCIDEATGEKLFRERLEGAQAFWASPIVVGQHVLCPNDKGGVHIVTAGPELKVERVNSIDERLWSSPTVANGQLFIRGDKTLYCIAE